MIIEPRGNYYRIIISGRGFWIGKTSFGKLYDVYREKGEQEALKWLRIYGSSEPPYITPTLRNLYRELYGPR